MSEFFSVISKMLSVYDQKNRSQVQAVEMGLL